MKLYEEEMLDINESVNKYLDIEKLEDDIKIIHLLNHTSGLKNFVLCGEEFNLYEDSKPSEVVEKVSKVKFEDYISNNIFLQLGMNDSSFISKDNKDIARGYKKGRVTNLFHHSAFFGCGDIISCNDIRSIKRFIPGVMTAQYIRGYLYKK